MNKLTKLISVVGLIAFSVSAHAVIQPHSGVELGYDNNDTLNPLTVNTLPNGTFGFTDWVFAAKDDGLNGVEELGNGFNLTDLGLEFDGSTIVGSWYLSSDFWDSYDNAMFVVKGGGGNIDPDKYVAYLLNGSSTDGTYFTPFENANNGTPTDISHISLYVRVNPAVPEPSTYAMFGAAFLILGFAGYRTRNRKS